MSPWHLEERIEGFPVPAGAVVLPAPADQARTELGRLTARYGAVADRTARADRPLVLQGDCLTAVGILAGVQRRRENLSIIWLDAHGDFNTPEISLSGYLAGMSLAAATGRVPQLVGEPVKLRAVPDERCLLIGARISIPPRATRSRSVASNASPPIPTRCAPRCRSSPQWMSTSTSTWTSSTAAIYPACASLPRTVRPCRSSRTVSPRSLTARHRRPRVSPAPGNRHGSRTHRLCVPSAGSPP